MELIFSTNNSNKFSKTLDPGQCMGMSCDWAKVSLSIKNVYKDALTSGKWDIGQSAYEFGTSQTDVKIIDAFGMKVINQRGKGIRYNIATSQNVVEKLVGLGNGTYIWGFESPNGGHALGYKKTPTNYDFFDPNFGLQRTNNVLDFKATLMDFINNYYSDLLKYMDIYEVALP